MHDAIFTRFHYKNKVLGALTPKVSRGDTSKYEGAPQLMLENIPMKFQDSRLNGC